MTRCRTGRPGPVLAVAVGALPVAALLVTVLLLAPFPATAQDRSGAAPRDRAPHGQGPRWAWPRPGVPLPGPRGPAPSRDVEFPAPARQSEDSRPAWQYGLASAAVPGIGQLARGQDRGFVYLLAEALVWIGFARERNLGLDARAAYRTLAWEVARMGAGTPGDGDFEYYERMARWSRSGAFDADPLAGGIQPETDPATFNGDAWRLAGELFLAGGPADPSNPGWEQAISFYRDRAYAEPLTWSWTGADAQYRRFGLLISESDTRLGRASLLVGGALLNRVVSSLDALLSRTAGRDASLRLQISPVAASPTGALQPVLQLRIATP